MHTFERMGPNVTIQSKSTWRRVPYCGMLPQQRTVRCIQTEMLNGAIGRRNAIAKRLSGIPMPPPNVLAVELITALEVLRKCLPL